MNTGNNGAFPWGEDGAETAQTLLHDVETQLRLARPAVFRTHVPASMVREFRGMAPRYGYSLAVDLTAFPDGPVRLLFTRKDLDPISPRPRGRLELTPNGRLEMPPVRPIDSAASR